MGHYHLGCRVLGCSMVPPILCMYIFLSISPSNRLLNIFFVLSMHEFFKMPLSLVMEVTNIHPPSIIRAGLLVRWATSRLLTSRSIPKAIFTNKIRKLTLHNSKISLFFIFYFFYSTVKNNISNDSKKIHAKQYVYFFPQQLNQTLSSKFQK